MKVVGLSSMAVLDWLAGKRRRGLVFDAVIENMVELAVLFSGHVAVEAGQVWIRNDCGHIQAYVKSTDSPST